jgi:hypothetical protein
MFLDIALVEGVLDIPSRCREIRDVHDGDKIEFPSKIPASSPHVSAVSSGMDRNPSRASR